MTILEIVRGFWDANLSYYRGLQTKRAANQQNDIDATKVYDEVHENASPVFVLSSGRAGTLYLSHILKQYTNISIEHEPENELIYYSKYAYENQSNGKEIRAVVDAARYEAIRNCYLQNVTYVETNNRITFFAHQLAELYPHAKFVHLVRNPEAFVKSGINRNWYSGKHLHDEGRIVPRDKAIWSGYSIEEKIAWLWNETNQFIENFKNSIPAERHFKLTSNELFSSHEKRGELLQFLGLDTTMYQQPKQVNKQIKKGLYSIDSEKIEVLVPLKKKYGF